MESSDWFGHYTRSVGKWWGGAIISLAMLGSGAAGWLYIVEATKMSPFMAILLVLLVASVLLNVRQVLMWRDENRSRRGEDERFASLEATLRKEFTSREARLREEITALKNQLSEYEDGAKSIPQPDREAIRDAMKAAGRIHHALTGFNIPNPPPHEKALDELASLDERSEEVVEYDTLHRAITDYKVCVAALVPRYRKIPLVDTASFETLLEPETAAYKAVVRECRRLLRIKPPGEPPTTAG